jgi:hypothetical protein
VTPRRHRLTVAGAVLAVVTAVVVQASAAAGAGVLTDRYLRTAREDDTGGSSRRWRATTARRPRPPTGPPPRDRHFPGARPPIAADVTRAANDCRDLARVDALAASGRRAEALGGYLEFRRVHRFSPLYARVPDRLGKVLRTGRLTPDRETCVLLAQLVAPGDEPASADTMPRLLTTCGEMLAASRDKNNRERNLGARCCAPCGRSSPARRRRPARKPRKRLSWSCRRPASFHRTTVARSRRFGRSRAGAGGLREPHARDHDVRHLRTGRGTGGGAAGMWRCPKLDEKVGDCTRKGYTAVVTLPAGTYRVWISIREPSGAGTGPAPGG